MTRDDIRHFYSQASIWWGDDSQETETHMERVETLHRLCGKGPWKILELGCGSGRSAAAMADCGHDITGIEFNPTDYELALKLLDQPRKGKLSFIQGDFFQLNFPERFDIIICWQVFGLEEDDQQRALLQRMEKEWLKPKGMVLMDVYHPFGPIRDHQKEWCLDRLEDVPGSVDMTERCTYDAIGSRWIDEWIPTAHPEDALFQSIRCYTPADFKLLLLGTKLQVKWLEIDGQSFSQDNKEGYSEKEMFLYDYNYLVQLVLEP